MRPAMDNSQDIGDVVSRVTMLEGQLQKVLDDIKSGRLVNAGAAGGQFCRKTGPDAGAGGPYRQRQVHHYQPADGLLSAGSGADPLR